MEQTPQINPDENAETSVKSLSGLDEGIKIQSEGQTVAIVGDTDADGNVIGWHKEAEA